MDGDGTLADIVQAIAEQRAGDGGSAQLLLDGGADPECTGSDGPTPLMAAAVQGQPEVLRLLLARGAAMDAAEPRTGCTAFHFACATNQPDCAEVLARAGCDVGLKNSVGKTGRELAEAEGHAAVVERLRAVVTEQLLRRISRIPQRAAQAAARAAPEPEPAAAAMDGFTKAAQVGAPGPARR